MRRVGFRLLGSVVALGLLSACVMKPPPASGDVKDPGVRAGAPGAGEAIKSIDKIERIAFDLGKEAFAEAESTQEGLGPRMNLDSCAGCHAAPAHGGSSPAVNPQVAFATLEGGQDKLPSFIRGDGPVRVVRFQRNADGSADGGVHALFTLTGRPVAKDCKLKQPDFEGELARRNLALRIPTPVFGAGLLEMIPDSEILANVGRNRAEKDALGIRGKANFVLPSATASGQSARNGNDGKVGRFGWKAQGRSLMAFAAEEYNVQMGISNDFFAGEQEEDAACQLSQQPNDFRVISRKGLLEVEDVLEAAHGFEKFSFFMRFLAPPAPVTDGSGGAASIERGRASFDKAGCALCHVPALKTGDTMINSLRSQPVNLFSDLLLHDMGEGLGDGISQGQAGPREFRTAPLWGLGQRSFFLHDGRTSDLREAVQAHSSRGSEANEVIRRFYGFTASEQQDLYNFLRSL